MGSVAMKVYSLDWFVKYRMSYQEAAVALLADGVDIVLTQNQIDPLPTSGVDQEGYLTADRARANSYEDSAWVDALREAGLTVLQTTATFFDPPALERFPDARPINALGESDRGLDWYTGVCPTHQGYLQWKIERLSRVVEELEPDGLFLQFTRWPGFWENWTLNPDYDFTRSDQYCFCDRCRGTFQHDTGINVRGNNLASQARDILEHYQDAWIDWKSRLLRSRIEHIASETGSREKSLSLMLNTLPFPATDLNGQDVRRSICGQDLTLLDGTINRFELMTYLQILNRPPEWIADTVTDARARTGESSEIVCTLQVAPLYTSGVHAARRRSDTIAAEDLEHAAKVAFDSGVDGLVFYHWGDFLDDESAGGGKREALRRIAARAKMKA